MYGKHSIKLFYIVKYIDMDQILRDKSDRIEIDVYYNNVLTAPTTITIKTITDPNGVVRATDQTVTAGTTTGRYYYIVESSLTNILGIYTAVWEFVIGGTTYQHSQEFEVVDTVRSGYIVPEDVRDRATYSGITTTSPSDSTLEKLINKSTVLIDTFLGGSVSYAQYSEDIRCVLNKPRNGVHIQLKHRPIISLTSVTLTATPANALDLDTDNIRINEESGYLEYFYDISYPTLKVCTIDPSSTTIIPVASVVYTAGYTVIPEDVKMAASMIVEELYKQEMGEGKDLVTYQLKDQKWGWKNSQAKDDASSVLGLDNAVAIRRLLRNYRQPMVMVSSTLG